MKRTKSESPDQFSSNPKRTKHNEAENQFNLLDFTDDVLLNIFQFVSPFDLMSLYLCCNRLRILCCDRTLWTSLDLRAKYLPLQELKKYVKFMQPITKLVAIKGNKFENEFPELSLSFLNNVIEKCEKLENFYVEDYKIPRQKIQIINFPRTLEKLSLQGTLMTFDKNSYLGRIGVHMPNLTSLVLTNCNWLNSYSLVIMSRIPKLKEVRLNSCHGLAEEIAYASIACRTGLKSLEVADLRDTFVGDSVISAFSFTEKLTELYLECPNPETRQHQVDEPPLQQQRIIHVHLQQGQAVVQNENDMHQQDVNRLIFQAFDSDSSQITDRSICSLGQSNTQNNQMADNWDEIHIHRDDKPRKVTNPNLKKLVVRNYTNVTNRTLVHFSVNGPNLEYLDVTGTSVTREGIQNFKIQRPNVTLISSFNEI